MKVVSLFGGMECGRLALSKIESSIDEYFSSEIDPFARKEVAVNFPEVNQMGDVTKWRDWDIDWSSIDLIMGGSPCQGFSLAGELGGTKADLNGEIIIVSDRETYLKMKEAGAKFLSQSHLFWEFVLCLDFAKEKNPEVKFMLENVVMAKNNLDMITEALGVSPVFINSNLVVAQDRKRWYWCNWKVNQPEDLGVRLKSVIQPSSEVDDVFYYSDKSIAYMERGNDKWMQAGARRADRYTQNSGKEKAFTITANFYKGVPYNYFQDEEGKHRKLTVVECCRLQGVPEDYFKVSSNSQAYKMLGNGWTVPVISHILKSGGF